MSRGGGWAIVVMTGAWPRDKLPGALGIFFSPVPSHWSLLNAESWLHFIADLSNGAGLNLSKGGRPSDYKKP